MKLRYTVSAKYYYYGGLFSAYFANPGVFLTEQYFKYLEDCDILFYKNK